MDKSGRTSKYMSGPAMGSPQFLLPCLPTCLHPGLSSLLSVQLPSHTSTRPRPLRAGSPWDLGVVCPAGFNGGRNSFRDIEHLGWEEP